MLRFVLVIITLLIGACSTEKVIDLEQLETGARSGDRQAVEQLVDLLGSREQELSDRVYTVIIDVGTKVVPTLLSRVQTTDKQMREYVIAALGTLKVEDAIPGISNVLASHDLQRRYVAAWALGEIGTTECIAPLIDALADNNSEVRRYATRALIKINKAAVSPLVDYLDSASGEGAAGAIRALGDITDKRALKVLIEQTKTAQKAAAFLALGKLRDLSAESVLIAGLKDPDENARMNAAMALGPLGGLAAVEALNLTLEDEVHVVREWSARSLEMITGNPVQYRNSQDEYVRPYQVYH